MIGAVAALFGLLGILWFIKGRPSFSTKRAFTGSSTKVAKHPFSLEGDNVALMFAVFGLGELLLSIASDLDHWHALVDAHGTTLGLLGAIVIVALVLIPGARGILGLVGAAAGTASVFVEHGTQVGIAFLVMVLLMMFLLTFIRGFRPGR